MENLQGEKFIHFKPKADLNSEFGIHCTLLLRFLCRFFFIPPDSAAKRRYANKSRDSFLLSLQLNFKCCAKHKYFPRRINSKRCQNFSRSASPNTRIDSSSVATFYIRTWRLRAHHRLFSKHQHQT